MYLFLSGCACSFLPYYSVFIFYFSLLLASLYSCAISLFQSLSHISVSFTPPGPCPLPFPPLPGSSPLFPSPISHMAGVLLVLASTEEHAGVVHVSIGVHCRSSPTPLRYSHIEHFGQSAWDAEHQISLYWLGGEPSERPDTPISGAHHSPADSQPETRQESPAPGHWEAMPCVLDGIRRVPSPSNLMSMRSLAKDGLLYSGCWMERWASSSDCLVLGRPQDCAGPAQWQDLRARGSEGAGVCVGTG